MYKILLVGLFGVLFHEYVHSYLVFVITIDLLSGIIFLMFFFFFFQQLLISSRNLEFFTNGYRYLIQILPAAVVAPMYFSGKIEFGVINQSISAFNHILGDFSLIVFQFQSISAFSAVIDRLGTKFYLFYAYSIRLLHYLRKQILLKIMGHLSNVAIYIVMSF